MCAVFAFEILLTILSAFVVADDDDESRPQWTMPMWIEEVPLMWEGRIFTYKSLYVGELFVGTPPKKFSFIFDTGSGNTVLPNVDCVEISCLNKTLYDRKNSTTSENITDDSSPHFPNQRVHIRYGDGDLTGSFVRDRICISENLCVHLNMVEAKQMATNPFALFSFDGVLGLGLSSLSLSMDFSFVQQVMNLQPRMLRQLSVFLAIDGYENIITLGGYDRSRAIEEPKWAPVVKPKRGYWQVAVSSVRVAGSELDYCHDGACRAVTDLGSTLFSVPTPVILLVQQSLIRTVPPELHREDFDCINFVHDVKIDLQLEGFTLSLPAAEIMRPKPFKRRFENGTMQYVCTCKVHHVNFPPPLGPKVFILGHPLLRTYYTVYDWENKRIGFALADQSHTSLKPLKKRLAPPVHIRALNSTDYYIPHLQWDEEMERRIQRNPSTSD